MILLAAIRAVGIEGAGEKVEPSALHESARWFRLCSNKVYSRSDSF